jgi:hypothetical protein
VKRFSRLILGVVVAVFLSQTSPSQAKTVTIRVGKRGDSFSSITPTQVLLNLSTRLPVETGENVLVSGFIIGGTQDHESIIRAIGPSLGAAGVADPLPDPTLELHDANGVLMHRTTTGATRKKPQQSPPALRRLTIANRPLS